MGLADKQKHLHAQFFQPGKVKILPRTRKIGNHQQFATACAGTNGFHVFQRAQKVPAVLLGNHKNINEGDIVTTLLKCANGETVTLTHDCSLPRPYSRNYVVQGTKGIYQEDGDGIYLDGVTPIKDGDWRHDFQRFEEDGYLAKYEHPLWKKYSEEGIHAGKHGGMDYLVISAFVESVKLGERPPIDVYDTATWMAVTTLSEQSIATGSAPVPFPDFTNGMWIDREPYRRGIFCLDDVCNECFEGENK